MKKHTGAVFNLIKSMTMSEKRYFSLFSERHVIGSQNKYLILFNAIEQMKDDDDEALKLILSEQGVKCDFIAADKSYLYKLLLRCLSDFNNSKTDNLKVKELLIAVEVLFSKGLYADCLKLIHRAEKLANHCEANALMLEILTWKKRCVGYSLGVIKAQEVNNEIEHYLEKINNLKQITDLYYESYLLRFREEKSDQSSVREGFERLLRHPLLQDENNATTLTAKVLYLLTIAHYYYIIDDNEKEHEYLVRVIDLVDESPFYRFEYPLDYVAIFNRLLDLEKFYLPQKFAESKAKLEQFAEQPSIQHELVRQRVFVHTNVHELEFLLEQGTNTQIKHLITVIESGLNKISIPLEPFYWAQQYYLLAIAHLQTGDLSQALYYINVFINEFRSQTGILLYARGEQLALLIHFLLNNHWVVDTQSKVLLKKYRFIGMTKFEVNFIKILNKASSNPLAYNKKYWLPLAKLYEEEFINTKSSFHLHFIGKWVQSQIKPH